jgi:hypothetical protein
MAQGIDLLLDNNRQFPVFSILLRLTIISSTKTGHRKINIPEKYHAEMHRDRLRNCKNFPLSYMEASLLFLAYGYKIFMNMP